MSVDAIEKPTEASRVRRKAVRVLPTWLCWLLVVPTLGWAVIRIGGLERGPLVPLFAFTPYVAAWTLVPVVLALALRRWWAAGVAVLTAVALVGVVAPRAVADDVPVPDGPTLRVMTANLLAGVADSAAVVALVRTHRVDVLAVQEFTPGAQAALDRHGLAELLPHRQLNAEIGTTGSGLYARFPLSDGGTRRNYGGFTQAYATVAVPGAPPVLVESAHPCAPYERAQLRCWHTDLSRQPAATPDGPLRILAGDFNATLDHTPVRALLETGYVDAAAAAGAGLTGTWGPYDGDPIPPVAIDHVLADRRVGVRAAAVHPLPGSDHRAVLAELVLPPAG
ncbi:endonuclease/exonuclease/phosphatase family protein [Micromonospora sonneratiae]|uniref:Endonuclease/exonuclease/phosphatase family protein n=1 Tax=Micromonospora sonneratiae TaxID=1184706 RepID=A0ABW3YBT9_9ACTN